MTRVLAWRDIPLFARLPGAAATELERRLQLETFAPGEALLRKGDQGRALFAVAAGAVRVVTGSERDVVLGAGEVFGEMSLLSGLAVSARVEALGETRLWVLPRRDFFELVEARVGLGEALTHLVVARLREQSSAAQRGAQRIFCRSASTAAEAGSAAALARAIGHHEPGARHVVLAPGRERAQLETHSPDGGTTLFYAAPDADLAAGLEPGDAVVDWNLGEARLDPGRAHAARVTLVDAAEAPRGLPGPWHYRIPAGDVAAYLAGERSLAQVPLLDRLARWSTRRLVGLALGSGAARGFAHLGVLAVLEEAGLPIDTLSGTSIGGITALLYALGGSAPAAIDLARRTLGTNELVRRVRWVPRSSFLSGEALARRAAEISAGRGFADLSRRVQVVTCDLVRGEKFVLDQGPMDLGLLATAAIPGALPPVEHGSRLLVDGALVSRIPIDLLARERCGLRVAVNVLPSPVEAGDAAADQAKLLRRFERFLGFRDVIGRSWEVLGWWKGNSDAADADVLIEPQTHPYSGYDFATLDEMLQVGRAAAEAQLPVLRAETQRLFGGGACPTAPFDES